VTRGEREAMPTLALVLAGLFLAVGAVACHREPPVATALAAEGTVERGHDGAAQPVVFGTTLVVGDTLRTGAASRARLALAGGGVIRVGESARLRFQRGAIVGQQAPDIAVELGVAEVEEITSDVSILTAVGPARVARGAHVRVRADGDTASLEVVVGRAVMMDAGQEVAVEAGQGVRIKIGTPEVQRFALKVGEAVLEERAAPADPGPGGGADARGAAAGQLADGGGGVAERAPAAAGGPPRAAAGAPAGDAGPAAAPAHGGRGEGGRADITLAAGESATVHDGRPPAIVRLRVDGVCPADAIVEVGGRGHHQERLTGSRSVVLRLAAGTRSYRVRCANDASKAAARASGTLTIRRDTGYVPLARRAPVNVIDADGRKYTVLFQTRLPQLTLAWPGAPVRSDLELHIESSGGERVVAASPTRPLPTGIVQEGTYTLWYRAPDGKQSPKTTLSVRFDNAAPTAQFFRTPADANSPHGAIAVDGVTVDGAKVSVGGEPLAVDAHGRFRAAAKPLEGDDAVAVRLEHPRTGVHYYVRRQVEAR
jgi:hypothetical protein